MAYTLAGRKGGTVRFEPLENGIVEKESESYSSSVTEPFPKKWTEKLIKKQNKNKAKMSKVD